ncbi:SMP-30/gluconolactonase/LRE family protein [Sesbania bispinosa]|nr:SMP-30/gluconolactonase/LRE family protein [Sesbania bispinosa]
MFTLPPSLLSILATIAAKKHRYTAVRFNHFISTCDETAMPGASSLSKPQPQKSPSLYRNQAALGRQKLEQMVTFLL